MSRSKKIFAIVAAVFALLLLFVVIDISRRTTFPGGKPAAEADSAAVVDSTAADSLRD